jgi:hypothetical protein
MVQGGASRLGLDLSWRTDGAKVAELISLLRPHDLGVALVRLGGERDGGYLVPDDFDGIRHCFSPGVSDVADFERALSDRGIFSFLADYSVDAPPAGLKDCSFTKAYVGSRDTDRTMRLETWIERSLGGDTGDLILQMDIEGAEYETLLSTPPEVLRRFRTMVVEFHSMNKLSNPYQFRLADAVFRKLMDDFEVAHIHPNNGSGSVGVSGLEIPRLMEFTFLRKDRVKRKAPAARFPHPLDRPNLPNRPDLVLPQCWWS